MTGIWIISSALNWLNVFPLDIMLLMELPEGSIAHSHRLVCYTHLRWSDYIRRATLISILCKNYAKNPMGDITIFTCENKAFRRGSCFTKLMVCITGKYLLYVYELITLIFTCKGIIWWIWSSFLQKTVRKRLLIEDLNPIVYLFPFLTSWKIHYWTSPPFLQCGSMDHITNVPVNDTNYILPNK